MWREVELRNDAWEGAEQLSGTSFARSPQTPISKPEIAHMVGLRRGPGEGNPHCFPFLEIDVVQLIKRARKCKVQF